MVRACGAMMLAGAMLVMTPAAGHAQLYYQPQPRPIVTADNDTWFQAGEAITFEGHFYYPAGPRVYFDANVMVRTGSYRGVPLYADTTREPYSLVFVPLAAGLMQPYERRRTGDAAGGTGTQAPSFPVDIAGEPTGEPGPRGPFPMTPGPPVWNEPDDLRIERRMADTASATQRRLGPAAPATATRGGEAVTPVSTLGLVPPRDVIEAGAKPKGLNEIYVVYEGYRWRSAGPAVPMREAEYQVAGEYHGHPVYHARTDDKEAARIFLEGKPGFVAPYERAGRPVSY
jgi:hypothetical protein